MDRDTNSSRRGTIAALVVLALLAGAGVLLASRMRQAADVQDCVMQGRTNCAPIR